MKKELIIFMPSIEGGGVEKNLFIISKFLVKKKLNLSLITTSKSFRKKFRGVNLITPKINTLNWGRKSKYFICLILLLREFFVNKRAVIFSFQANLYCILLSKIFNRKIIIRSNSSPSGWSQNKFKKFIFKFLLKLADKIIVNSKDFKSQYREIFNLNPVMIYNPLNKNNIISLSKKKINFPFFSKNKNSIKIINIGRFTDQKDHMTLLKAVNFIKKNNFNFKLLIVGRGINFIKMKKFIKKYNLKKNVRIVGYKTNPFPYLKLANLFILTSKFEGLPNVLLEAAVLKKIIISTNCPTGPKEILQNGKNGFLSKIGDYKDIGKKIISIKKNKKEIKKMIYNNYKSLNRFDYEKNLNKYLNEINKISNQII